MTMNDGLAAAAPMTIAGSAPQFAIRSNGLWLHFALNRGSDGALRMTDERAYRWTGTAGQLATVRKRFPEVVGMETHTLPATKRSEVYK
jgi:hypothetical protein